MSLPNASKQQMDAMMRIAEEKMKKDGVIQQEVVEQEVQQDIQEEPAYIQESSEEIEEVEVEEEIKPKSSSNALHIKELREKAARADALARELEEMRRAMNQPSQVVEEDDSYDDIDLDDDALAEGKHLKKALKKIYQLEKQVKQYQTKTTQDTVEVKLKTRYPDFDKVVTPDNLSLLRDMNPDLADTILRQDDQFKQAKLAYEMVKQFGIYKDEESYARDRALAQKNAAKPKPLAAVSPQQSDSPLSKANAFANGLTDDVKKALWKEMQQYKKG